MKNTLAVTTLKAQDMVAVVYLSACFDVFLPPSGRKFINAVLKIIAKHILAHSPIIFITDCNYTGFKL